MIKEAIEKKGEVTIYGFVHSIRRLKERDFIIIRDRSGKIQVTVEGSLREKVKKLTRESYIKVSGKVIESKYTKEGVELIPKDIEVLTLAETPLPLEFLNVNSSLDKRLDYRWLDLRNERNRKIFEIQTTVENSFREFFYKNSFIQIHSSKILAFPSESGANVFSILYFDREAYLAQSPQFYKQMAIASGFEKVFEISQVYRAEKHFTTRHLCEYTSIDAEIANISSHEEIMDFEEKLIKYVLEKVKEKHEKEIESFFNTTIPIPKRIPRIKMEEAYEIVSREGIDEEGDLNPKGEKDLGNYVKESYDSDFVFLTDFPWKVRPFYHKLGEPMKNGELTTKSFDLIYKGLEVTTGSQREERYEILVKQAKEKGLHLEPIKFYLEFFKYGIPPHGGFGLGLERFTKQLLNLTNVRESTFTPRDPKRLLP